jgi:hypothetical protein
MPNPARIQDKLNVRICGLTFNTQRTAAAGVPVRPLSKFKTPYGSSNLPDMFAVSESEITNCKRTRWSFGTQAHRVLQAVYNFLVILTDDIKTLTCTITLLPFYIDVLSNSSVTVWRQADHSPPSRMEVKNAWSYTSTPPYVFKVQLYL